MTLIDAAAVARLVARQFPGWADRTVTAVPSAGSANALFRLGDDLVVRLPRHRGAAAAVELELKWLPWLARRLPLAIPVPVAAGQPDEVFPRPWVVFRWLRGTGLDSQDDVDLADVAVQLGHFVAALRDAGIADAPDSLRVNPLQRDGSEVHADLAAISAEGIVDTAVAAAVWQSAVSLPASRPVWIHGDLFPMNLLTDQGRLSAVIDFDLMGAGDPAIDMLPAWAMLTATTRPLFRAAAGVDEGTWIRGRGFALAGGLRVLRKYGATSHPLATTGPYMLAQTIADFRQTS